MKLVAWVVGYVVFLALAITACGSGGAPSDVVTLDGLTIPITDAPGGPYTLAGSVVNLQGNGLILQNGDQQVTVNAPANPDEPSVFVFDKKLDAGSDFSITIKQQPTGPNQICTIGYGEGRAVGTVRTPIVNCALPPKFAYMLRANDILKYDFDQDTGTMTSEQSYAWGGKTFSTSYYSLVKHPIQHYIFVFHAYDRVLESFHVDQATGQLERKDTKNTKNEDGNAFRVRFSTDGEYIYVGGKKNGIYGYHFDKETGTMTPINGENNLVASSGAPSGLLIDDFVIDNTRGLLYGSNTAGGIYTFRIDKDTGLLEYDQHYSGTHGADMLAITNDGEYLFASYSKVAADTDIEIIKINGGVLSHQDDVELSQDPNASHQNFWAGISVDPTSKVLFVNEKNAGDIGAYPIADFIGNAANHVQYAVITRASNIERTFFSFSPDGKFVFSQHHELGTPNLTGMDGYEVDMSQTTGGFTKLALPSTANQALAFVIY